jgi:hypothetical protein
MPTGDIGDGGTSKAFSFHNRDAGEDGSYNVVAEIADSNVKRFS